MHKNNVYHGSAKNIMLYVQYGTSRLHQKLNTKAYQNV